ncbi:hypothetical protein HPB47_001564 [Ixodes persulcatus]|uniref:Uncharacterized protein n=1 Tax=Ixodes persulcatus TaxID=34615 RepID=A0AC60PNT8_IXOPE|nr:hypothetical protein HPB47_001564 [Ixodes persulcatus]
MSLYRWFKPVNVGILLPEPQSYVKPSDQEACAAANNLFVQCLQQDANPSKRRKTYGTYDGTTRAKIARLALEQGNTAAAIKMTRILGHTVSESTVRSIRDSYLRKIKLSKSPLEVLPHATRGRKLKLGNLDQDVQDYIRKLRERGGIVNRTIIIAAAWGIVKVKQPSKLPENGGSLTLGRKWAESMMKRMNLVRRKATRTARKVPTDFENIKSEFLAKVENVVRENKIAEDMIINWDQTGYKLVPVSDWTLEEGGSRQISVVGREDKREITVLFALALGGAVLPPQVIYIRKTTRCHAAIDFPDSWDIWHSPNHWSTTDTMLRCIDTIFIPYLNQQRKTLGLLPDAKALCIFDVFAAHRTDSTFSRFGLSLSSRRSFPYNQGTCLVIIDGSFCGLLRSFFMPLRVRSSLLFGHLPRVGNRGKVYRCNICEDNLLRPRRLRPTGGLGRPRRPADTVKKRGAVPSTDWPGSERSRYGPRLHDHAPALATEAAWARAKSRVLDKPRSYVVSSATVPPTGER